MISIKNVSKEYIINNDEKLVVFQSLNFSFKKNKMYAIMGHSGSGKSTLLHILALLDFPTEGSVIFDNQNTKKLSSEQLAEIRSKNIGIVFQSFYLNQNMRAYENVMLPMYLNKEIDRKKRKATALKLLSHFGLEDRKNHLPKQLSGGEQQRVAIARALANNPDYIVADEPTGNLDKDNELIIFNALKEISKNGKCVIIASHNPEIKKYADEVIYLDSRNI